ncbi:peptidyl-prolyl cis-trans isomerase-like [Iris pallida]|uniref:Peptidyl-prolyl cis-trans isomerase-like n=1 Tax=Iris pallida TaxID=29817 RepID=A0AAX6E8N7_IRIPA|nr:peptidyl-prolyl cis-trans isomerase-like [Iris pallida]
MAPNPKVFFDMTIGGAPAGRIVMELYATRPADGGELPRAVHREKGTGRSWKPIHYKGPRFHCVIPGFMCQGATSQRGNETGGESIYGEKFADENFVRKHQDRGVFRWRTRGPDERRSSLSARQRPHAGREARGVRPDHGGDRRRQGDRVMWARRVGDRQARRRRRLRTAA